MPEKVFNFTTDRNGDFALYSTMKFSNDFFLCLLFPNIRCFNDLQGNTGEINPDTSQTLITLAAILKDSKLFSTLECSYENLVRMHGIWKINAFHPSNADKDGIIGDAIYVLGSAFKHSCRPNALRVIEDDSYRAQVSVVPVKYLNEKLKNISVLKIRCIEAIPLGESPKIEYFNDPGIRPIKARQHTLMWFFGFHCECVLCESEKVASVVDYREVRKVLGDFYREKMYGNDQLLIAKNILTELEKIYCKYDKRITDLYDYTLANMVATLQGPHAFMVSIPQLNEFAKQVEENLRITYGIDHIYYKNFAEEIAPKLQQAS